jgi:hypothetical protein
MAEPHSHLHADETGPADNELVHHEESDVNIRGVFIFAAGLFVVAVVVHLAIWGVFRYFDAREAEASELKQFPLATGAESLPPEPRLQEAPREELRTLRERELERLNGYGWIDQNAGVVHIPIAEAMKLTLQRGLPSRAEGAGGAGAAGGAGEAGQAGQAGQAETPAGGQR